MNSAQRLRLVVGVIVAWGLGSSFMRHGWLGVVDWLMASVLMMLIVLAVWTWVVAGDERSTRDRTSDG
jgi:hypothetical protein